MVQSRARLGVLVGRALALGGQLEAAETYLQSAEGALADSSQPDLETLRGQIAATRASIAIQRSDSRHTIEYARQAISYLPPTEGFVRSLAAFTLGDAHLLTGDVVPAGAAFADAVDSGLATGSLHMVTVSSAYLARTQMLRGRLGEAERVCQRALKVVAEVAEAPGRTVPTLGMLYAYLGQLRRELDDLEGAGRYLGQALELGQRSGYVEGLAASYWALAQLRRTELDVPAGLAMIERAIETVREQNLTATRRLLLAERADLLVALGRLDEAESWAREHRVGESLDFEYSRERERLSLVRLRLARGEVDDAIRLLTPLLSSAESAGRFGVVIELLALQALALNQSGKLPPAISSLERALVLAEPEGYVRAFADHGEPMGRLLRQVAARVVSPEYVARLLAAIESPGRGFLAGSDVGSAGEPASLRTPGGNWESGARPDLVDSLTARELEVLGLLAGGASNQAIADRLTVSVGTAKAHISHILGKLGAHNRTEAVARARNLGLVE